MNDEQFEQTMLGVAAAYSSRAADALRARDDAQRNALALALDAAAKCDNARAQAGGMEMEIQELREALARVEAERDTAIVQMQNIRKERDRINKELGDTGFNLCIAQQQLAEAVGLLKSISASLDNGGCDLGKVWARVEALLSSHAQAAEVTGNSRGPVQAEQQENLAPRIKCPVCKGKGSARFSTHTLEEARCEPCDGKGTVETAQGAQAADERELFEAFATKGHPEGYRKILLIRREDGRYESDEMQECYEGWMARAALATQPAAGDPVAHKLVAVQANGEWQEVRGKWVDGAPIAEMLEGVEEGYLRVELAFSAPPAAAHGDDTRRIDWLACTWRLGGKLPDVDHGSFREVIDAAMRAQGDGEVQ